MRAAARAFLLLVLLWAIPARAADPAPDPSSDPPIVFVHGNGDSAALWMGQIWRFESNGYARGHLLALNLKDPLARTNDGVEQEGRSSAEDVMQQLAGAVLAARRQTGAAKVALVGNSRGANTIRNYLRFGGGAEHVSHAVLGGGTNHGVIVSDTAMVGSEFNGASPLMKALNEGADEVVAGVRFLTLRSDRFDKYAQPDGAFIGRPGEATGIGFEAPALKGAENVVLAGLDHREVSYSPAAFVETFRFVTGRGPSRVEIMPEAAPVLDGVVTGTSAGVYSNRPLAGASVEVYAVDPATGERRGETVHRRTTGEDGVWGPFTARSDTHYEFVLQVDGRTTHIYRPPFPRGTTVLHLRPAVPAQGDDAAGSVVTISRPRGYFGAGRDIATIDGQPAAGIAGAVPTVSTARLVLPSAPPRAVAVRFNQEFFAVRTWPAAERHLVIAEFQD